MAKRYAASDEFIAWAQSLSGMLTTIRSRFESAGEMVEHMTWDEGKTEYFLALIKSLHNHISEVDSELSCHVKEKFRKE